MFLISETSEYFEISILFHFFDMICPSATVRLAIP